MNSGGRWLRRATRKVGWCLALFFAAFSCERQTDDPTGGETHFLVRCQPGSNSCGNTLSCLCGVCTLPCNERATCERLPGAACVASNGGEACAGSEAPGHCDVACFIDADCSPLSGAHRCEAGACRADSSQGVPTSSAGAAGDGGASEAGACAHGNVSANQVLVIGDSFFAATHQMTAYLEELARGAGALSTGERYRDNSRLNANTLANGGIADQYAAAIADADVKAVIMSGGGADLLVGSCDTVDANCPAIAGAAAAARELLDKMAGDGVADAVYVFYPDPVKDPTPNLRAKVDALRPLIENACTSSAVRCHFLDLRPTFAAHYDAYVQADGINPTQAGSQATAQAVWALMQSECIAQ